MLENSGKCEEIVITKTDKGGVVVMDKCEYKKKMMDLLNYSSTYEGKYAGSGKKEAKEFDREVRKIL